MQKIFKFFYLLLWLTPFIAKAATPLPVHEAFKLSAQFAADNELRLTWQIVPGYHLYRDRFVFTPLSTDKMRLQPVKLPPGAAKTDDILGHYQVYERQITIPLKITFLQPQGQYLLNVTYQGCADSGFCYPPVTQQLSLTLTSAEKSIAMTAIKQTITLPALSEKQPAPPRDEASELLAQHNWFIIFGGFLGFGLLLAFTPCVLPMLPILSGIIIGQGAKRTTLRSFYLSLTYALAVAITYAIAGAIAALAGSYVQAFFQNPWVIGACSLFFVALALSMFGFYDIRLPARWNHYLTQLSHRQQSGAYVGVFIMGCLSVLIISPCVTAPLIGTLTYLSATGNILLGATALFAMGLGMGIPLIIAGTFEGKWLPKSGPWLNGVKAFFGVLLIALAIYLLERIIPATAAMFLWGALSVLLSMYLINVKKTGAGWRHFWRGMGIILLIYGGAVLIGALQGNTDLLRPLANITQTSDKKLHFQKIKSVQDLQEALQSAQNQRKAVVLDIYADWCVSCHIIERQVFQNERVQTALKDFILLRADVTANDAIDQTLQRHLNVIAPPAIIFYDANGVEIKDARAVGEIDSEAFLSRLLN